MIIMPQVSQDTGDITARTAFLSPHFEEGRVRMLGIPSQGPLEVITWEEHWDPYGTLRRSELFAGFPSQPKIMVDEELRDFIARGLESAEFQTVGLNSQVELVRQIKSPAEIEILRAVNTGTVAAVRALQPCLKAGLTENQVRDILDAALMSIGFLPFFDIVLFEEHGALPHGGFVTGNKQLERETMVVIDVGAHYLGYSSDICRSFFMNYPEISWWQHLVSWSTMGWEVGESDGRATASSLHQEKIKIWDIVFEAQSEAAAAFTPNNTAATVDIAARSVIEGAGYGSAFTHRVGHGIGIKGEPSSFWDALWPER